MSSRFYCFLVESVPFMVTKSSYEAKKHETVESKRLGDSYVAASFQTDNFYTYQEFSASVLRNAGFTEPEIKKYKIHKSQIPKEKRNACVRFAREEFLNSYVEQNEYYRALHGDYSVSKCLYL